MKKIILTVIEVIAVVIVVVAFLSYTIGRINRDHQEDVNDKIKIENELKASSRLLEQRLTASEQQRLVLDRTVDSLNHTVAALVCTSSRLDSTLKLVKGKYNKRTVNELEVEMISRYNASK